MKTTSTFDRTAEAYYEGYTRIINRGGTRSGKSFATLQLLFLIAFKSKKSRMITCVSHSFPHLEMGIVRDFDKILLDNDIIPDTVRTKKPYIYKIGKSTIEFISVDNLGKSLGAARDILFGNECNKIKHNIIHQLSIRTDECSFFDFNPDGNFWLYEHEYHKEEGAIEIVSTYLDNIENLSEKQLKELQQAKARADKEKAEGKSGYWSFWWQVYGRGEMGRMIDRLVYPNYTVVPNEIPKDYKHIAYGIDYGFSIDPTAVGAMYIKGENLIIDELVYETNLVNIQSDDIPEFSIEERLNEANIDRNVYIISESVEPKSITELRGKGFNIYATKKPTIKEGIRITSQYNIMLTERSKNIIKEFDNYLYPIDKDDNIVIGNPLGADHALDFIKYVLVMKGRLWN